MNIVRFESAAEFAAAASPFLEEHEAEHNLILGIVARLVHGGRPGPLEPAAPPAFWLVEDGGQIAGAAMITPPHDLVVSRCADAVPPALAAELTAEGWELPGLHGPAEAADALAAAWHELTDCQAALFRASRIYRCTALATRAGAPGELRPATSGDRELLAAWYAAFGDETGEPVSGAVAAEIALDDGVAFVWVDGSPVSFAASNRRTRTGASIGPVYTPPEWRGRGYGSAVTAALTQLLLDSGRAFCCLYTDLANPVSNRIYQRLGYRPVADVSHYRFRRG